MRKMQKKRGRETFVFGGMRALMTNIQQVNIWVEAEAFFDPSTDADITLRIAAEVPIHEVGVEQINVFGLAPILDTNRVEKSPAHAGSCVSSTRYPRFFSSLIIFAVRADRDFWLTAGPRSS